MRRKHDKQNKIDPKPVETSRQESSQSLVMKYRREGTWEKMQNAVQMLSYPRYRYKVYLTLGLLVFMTLIYTLYYGLTYSSDDMLVQDEINYLARNLDIKVKVLENMEYDYTLLRVTLTNKGSQPIINKWGWEIYFNYFRKHTPSEKSQSSTKDTDHPEKQKVSINHIDGGLLSLSVKDDYLPLKKSVPLIVEFKTGGYLISRSDFFPNWYVAAKGARPRIIECTSDDSLKFVEEFDVPKGWKDYPGSLFDPITPEQRYENNFDIIDQGPDNIMLIPTPVKMEVQKGTTMTIESESWKIVHFGDFKWEVKNLADLFGNMDITTEKLSSKCILFEKAKVSPLPDVANDDQAYSISMYPSNDIIHIKASTGTGALYAVMSLYKLSKSLSKYMFQVPVVQIVDEPRFKYRGLHLDVARSFRTKREVFRLLDLMTAYKFNQFHLHLSDDESWRLEIPGLLELTEYGGRRCHSLHAGKCQLPQLGSGPHPVYPGSGFYTVQDYIEILRYARERHITVIPEIDAPGHSNAAVSAMKARCENLNMLGKASSDAGIYNLHDPDDKSNYKSVQSFMHNCMNPCLNSTYTFMRHVMKALISMHKDIQPLKLLHFGGDEVPEGVWADSPACQKLFPDLKVGIKRVLMEFFIQKITKIASELNLNMAAWEDGIMDKTSNQPFNKTHFPSDIEMVAYPWKNVWKHKSAFNMYALANADYKVITSLATHLYFDHAQEVHPEERGLYWACRYIDTRKVFNFMPFNILQNGLDDLDMTGRKMDQKVLCLNEKCPTLEKPENIIGIEGHLWGELMRSRDILDTMVFPRLVALAERAWHKASWETETRKTERNRLQAQDYSKFASHLGHSELSFLDSLNVNYWIPPPGAKLKESRLWVNSQFPGLQIQISYDEGKTWNVVNKSVRVDSSGKLMLRTLSANKQRWSRTIHVSP